MGTRKIPRKMAGEDQKDEKKLVGKSGKEMDVEAKINDIMMEGGKVIKMEVDYSETVAKKVPEAKELAKKNLNEALEMLTGLEKQTRTGADMHSTAKVLVCIVQICYEAKNWTTLNEHIIMLTKKRSQLKQAVAKMVQECCVWIKEGTLPNKEIELELIDTLRTVTEGKIYVEVERARLTHRLSMMKEAEGKIKQELQVETYGSMDRKEKVELILEQMRLCLASKDYIRSQIMSKKISIRFFENVDHQELKLKFYRYMIEMDEHERNYLNICRHYRAVYDTPSIQEDSVQKLQTLKNVALFIVLSPYDNEQSDLIHHILKEKNLKEIPKYKSLLEQFINQELIDQKKLVQLYGPELKQGSKDSPPTSVFNEMSEEGRKRWDDLKNRVVEHNIRIMAKYYTKVTLKRMSELLDLKVDETEDFLSKMVVDKCVEAKVDRLDGIVHFSRNQDPNEMLNDWSHNISDLMGLVMKTTHLINREEMVHKHMAGLKIDEEKK